MFNDVHHPKYENLNGRGIKKCWSAKPGWNDDEKQNYNHAIKRLAQNLEKKPIYTSKLQSTIYERTIGR